MIQKPRRRDLKLKFGTCLEVMAVILGLILIPFMALIPQKIRLNILYGIYRLSGGEQYRSY